MVLVGCLFAQKISNYLNKGTIKLLALVENMERLNDKWCRSCFEKISDNFQTYKALFLPMILNWDSYCH